MEIQEDLGHLDECVNSQSDDDAVVVDMLSNE